MLEIIRNRPEFLTANDRADVTSLLAQSGLIQTHSIASRIKRAFLVLLAKRDGEPMATLSVKKPDRAYIADVFDRANVKLGNQSVELGYLYAKPGAAGLWSGPKLGAIALETCRTLGVSMFAVTRADNAVMTRYLDRLGAFRSEPFASTRGSYKLLLWTTCKQQAARVAPVVVPVAPYTGKVEAMSPTSRQWVYVPREFRGKVVIVTVKDG